MQVRKLLANRVTPPQDPAAALDPLPPNSAAREQVSGANLGQVHAFVEHALARDDLVVAPGEVPENLCQSATIDGLLCGDLPHEHALTHEGSVHRDELLGPLVGTVHERMAHVVEPGALHLSDKRRDFRFSPLQHRAALHEQGQYIRGQWPFGYAVVRPSEAGPDQLLSELIPLLLLLGGELNGMEVVVVWHETDTDRLREGELEDGLAEEIGDRLSSLLVVLQHRRRRQPEPILEAFRGPRQESWSAKVV